MAYKATQVHTTVLRRLKKFAMKIHPTFQASIFCGLQGYTSSYHSVEEAEEICQEFVDDVGLCVTVTPTKFVYTNGREPGVIVGLINYPRFPSEPEDIKAKAVRLAMNLLKAFGQKRVSVVCTDETIMLESVI